ncbi:hypothetical protein EB796_009155 [Bugula neritina]|uniref:Uncharacterized protein n=1 Tax=Bugula neritina TaxID=10212 RepID=A0A7J7K3M4_BUGNE|nr:hypothetical protein EB796_009155 [Bugula neritina]
MSLSKQDLLEAVTTQTLEAELTISVFPSTQNTATIQMTGLKALQYEERNISLTLQVYSPDQLVMRMSVVQDVIQKPGPQ